jgi:hypothetical protein
MRGTLLDEEGRSGQGGRPERPPFGSKGRCPENRLTSEVSPSRGVSMSPGMTREWTALPSANSLWVATVAGASTLELGYKSRFATTDTVTY